jgi:AcrR family transcriptional regulator
MDDIAKEAGYSKATLYVYFKNKDEIISCMTLVAMNMLLDIVKTCTTTHKDFKSQYFALCYAITDFQKEHLFYYESIFKEINVDIELSQTPKVYHEIYEVGEEINKEILSMFKEGMAEGTLRSNIKLPQAAFTFWGSIFGVIHMAKEKNKHFSKCFNLSE